MKRFQMMTVAILAALSLIGTACTDREAEVETESEVEAPAQTGAIEGNESPSLSGSATTDAVETDETKVEGQTTVETED